MNIALLQKVDKDIYLYLPSGKKIVLQYRPGSPSIDIIMPEGEDTSVSTWKGIDMEPAPKVHNQDDVRLCGQLVIDLNPAWMEFPE